MIKLGELNIGDTFILLIRMAVEKNLDIFLR